MNEDSSHSILKLRVGRYTIEENLRRSVDEGRLIQHDDGSYETHVSDGETSPYFYHSSKKHLDCRFSMSFLFEHAYARSAVPFGCRECYKVLVLPRNLRELMALREIQHTIDCNSKFGVEVDREITQNIYVGFFYCITLEEARRIFKIVRDKLDANQRLGVDVPMRIKRGCTEYEIACGPADKYTFADEIPEIESYLLKKFRRTKPPVKDKLIAKFQTLALWIKIAFRIGDNTYLDFTKGKRLYPQTIDFDPNPNKSCSKANASQERY